MKREGGSKEALPDLYDRFHGAAFEVLGINSDADRDALRRLVAANHVDWPTGC